MKDRISLESIMKEDQNLSLNKLKIQSELKEKIINLQQSKLENYEKKNKMLIDNLENFKKINLEIDLWKTNQSEFQNHNTDFINKNTKICSKGKPCSALTTNNVSQTIHTIDYNKSQSTSLYHKNSNNNKLQKFNTITKNSKLKYDNHNENEKDLRQENNLNESKISKKRQKDILLNTSSKKNEKNKLTHYKSQSIHKSSNVELDNHKIHHKKSFDLDKDARKNIMMKVNNDYDINNSVSVLNSSELKKTPILNDSFNNESLLRRIIKFDFLGEKCNIISDSPINSPKLKLSCLETEQCIKKSFSPKKTELIEIKSKNFDSNNQVKKLSHTTNFNYTISSNNTNNTTNKPNNNCYNYSLMDSSSSKIPKNIRNSFFNLENNQNKENEFIENNETKDANNFTNDEQTLQKKVSKEDKSFRVSKNNDSNNNSNFLFIEHSPDKKVLCFSKEKNLGRSKSRSSKNLHSEQKNSPHFINDSINIITNSNNIKHTQEYKTHKNHLSSKNEKLHEEDSNVQNSKAGRFSSSIPQITRNVKSKNLNYDFQDLEKEDNLLKKVPSKKNPINLSEIKILNRNETNKIKELFSPKKNLTHKNIYSPFKSINKKIASPKKKNLSNSIQYESNHNENNTCFATYNSSVKKYKQSLVQNFEIKESRTTASYIKHNIELKLSNISTNNPLDDITDEEDQIQDNTTKESNTNKKLIFVEKIPSSTLKNSEKEILKYINNKKLSKLARNYDSTKTNNINFTEAFGTIFNEDTKQKECNNINGVNKLFSNNKDIVSKDSNLYSSINKCITPRYNPIKNTGSSLLKINHIMKSNANLNSIKKKMNL